MRVHHLNCMTTCPLGGRLMDGRTTDSLRGTFTNHCLLVETSEGLVLVDTGLGTRDVADPVGRLSWFFRGVVRPELRDEMTALRQVQRLRFDPRDVRHILLSHLDFDHAGGLDDFPHARVHLLADERDAAFAQKTVFDRMRYRPQQWSRRENWHVYAAARGESWFGFESVRDLVGLPPEILLIPLVGHSLGHAGIAVQSDDGWLLYAADAYFHHLEMDVERPSCPPALRLYQSFLEKDRRQRFWNQRRLRELRRSRGDVVTILCAHDVTEFERLAGRPFDEPAGLGTRVSHTKLITVGLEPALPGGSS